MRTKGGKTPLCACACGEAVAYNKNHRKFNLFVHGHHFRVVEYRETKENIKTRMKGNKLGPGRKWNEDIKSEFSKQQIGTGNNNWKGGEIVNGDGYILVKVYGKGYVMKHRLVMEKEIGRTLLPQEVVHHNDGNKQNNNIVNLTLFSSHSEHMKIDSAWLGDRRSKSYA